MIATVTLNPSIDYIVKAESLLPGGITRTREESVYPGGKGINVSVMLAGLGLESCAFGFTAGFTGEKIEGDLRAFGCRTAMIELKEGFSRINVKIHAQEESEINGHGPVITQEDVGRLLERLDGLKEGDWLVLAGSIPPGLPRNLYGQILARMQGRGIGGPAVYAFQPPVFDQAQQARALAAVRKRAAHPRGGHSGRPLLAAAGGTECAGIHGGRRRSAGTGGWAGAVPRPQPRPGGQFRGRGRLHGGRILSRLVHNRQYGACPGAGNSLRQRHGLYHLDCGSGAGSGPAGQPGRVRPGPAGKIGPAGKKGRETVECIHPGRGKGVGRI